MAAVPVLPIANSTHSTVALRADAEHRDFGVEEDLGTMEKGMQV